MKRIFFRSYNTFPMTPWTCPDCSRPFKHRNQAHSCVTIEAITHFENKPPHLLAIYRALEDAVKKNGNVRISPTKNAIMFVANSTFAAVKPKKNWIDIEFLLEKENDEYPIYKVARANKTRVAHFLRLEHPKEG